MICKSKLRVLFAMGVFVLGITTFASAGELIDDVLANIEQNSPELASTFENIFAIPEVEELAFAIESYFQQNGEIRDKQAGCQWHTPYSSICEFLDDLDECTDWAEEQIPKVKLTEMNSFGSRGEGDDDTDDDADDDTNVYFCDEGLYCPTWFYHFTRGAQDTTNLSRSYLQLRYTQQLEEDVPGAVIFYVYDEVDPPTWTPKTIPVNWKSNTDTQRIYFSCFSGLFDEDREGYQYKGYILDEYMRLFLLLSYWTVTDSKAFDTFLHNDYKFLDWFGYRLAVEQSNGNPSDCDNLKGEVEWDTGSWIVSPLLVITDEWFYRMSGPVWSSKKHSDFFDHVMLYVTPQAGDVDIEVSQIELRLNGRRILYYNVPNEILHFNKDQSLDLTDLTTKCRYSLVNNPSIIGSGTGFDQLGCALTQPYPIPLPSSPIIRATAKDYSQWWDYRYGIHWCNETDPQNPEKCEGNNPSIPWRPVLYGGWCGAYVSYILNKYMEVSLCGIFCKALYMGSPRDYSLGNYFRCFEWCGEGPHYLSYDTEVYWDDLTEQINPGSAIVFRQESNPPDYPEREHGAFFLDWELGETPANHLCWATFYIIYIIGGSQDSGRVSVNRAHLLNAECDPSQYAGHTGYYNCWWGPDDNGAGVCWFGKTQEWDREISFGGVR